MRSTVSVPSLSKSTQSYAVTRDGESFECSCIRFMMSPHARKECNHVALVARADTLMSKCAERHGLTEPPGLCRQCLVALLAISARHVKQNYILKSLSKEKVAAARKKRTRKKKVTT